MGWLSIRVGIGAALLASLTFFSCSSDDDETPCSRVCDRAIDCSPQSDRSACLEGCRLRPLSEACANAVTSAPCEEVNKEVSDDPTWADTCFPRCTSTFGGGKCAGDRVTLCDDDREITLLCAEFCKTTSANAKYSGSCGPTYDTQSCPMGGECCWCLI